MSDKSHSNKEETKSHSDQEETEACSDEEEETAEDQSGKLIYKNGRVTAKIIPYSDAPRPYVRWPN